MNDMPEKPSRSAAGFILFCGATGSPKWLALHNATHGAWAFPKGHSREDEDLLVTARRELFEETGIENITIIENFKYEIEYDVALPVRGNYHKRVVFYLASVSSQNVTLSPEHDKYRWLSSEKMLELIVFDNLREAFRAALSHLA